MCAEMGFVLFFNLQTGKALRSVQTDLIIHTHTQSLGATSHADARMRPLFCVAFLEKQMMTAESGHLSPQLIFLKEGKPKAPSL